MCVCVCVCDIPDLIYIYIHTHTYTYIHTLTHTYTHTHTYIYIYLFMCVYVYLCECVYVYTYPYGWVQSRLLCLDLSSLESNPNSTKSKQKIFHQKSWKMFTQSNSVYAQFYASQLSRFFQSVYIYQHLSP